MCHPDASNTHPETYPKYQVQLGRVALLRDMINWCIENPARGRPLADGDPRMRAMEAYIYAKRKGVKLEYGRSRPAQRPRPGTASRVRWKSHRGSHSGRVAWTT
ncbi:c-type cytochrome [Myxococcus sp. NMCA1]